MTRLRGRGRSWRLQDLSALQARDMPQGSCRVLGLDPGSLRTGFGVVDCDGPERRHIASGCIVVRGASLADRLRHIYSEVTTVVATYRPAEIAIERVFMSRNADSALKLGQARGVALCAAASLGAPVFEYAPRAIKLAVVGYGNAEKLQVAHMVRAMLQLTVELQADAADALAISLCHGQTRRLAALAAGA